MVTVLRPDVRGGGVPRTAPLAEREPPALVISLDFELHWGVRDRHATSSGYMANVRGARDAIPRMLDLFAQFHVAATWATVGFLFAESRDELEAFHPVVKPRYVDARLNPYTEPVGSCEADDPLHYAPSLIRLIASAPRQEVGTHTYSHFYCLEPGAELEAFRQDIASAVAIARARGIEIRSVVLPRNQWNPAHAAILRDAGVRCFRGNQPGWMYRPAPTAGETRRRRAGRLVDAYAPLTRWDGVTWREIRAAPELHDVRAACFLRPVGERRRTLHHLRLERITRGMTQAAIRGRLFHLWWHPHNCGAATAENLAMLRRILEHHRALRSEYGMRSMTMIDASRLASRTVALRGETDHG